ncbi:ABC transporter ATP-binding protein [Halomarina litorea]|uniref:ABC transporter ATP-binding protein n=1 Tax=Halomarina litorea TaxID=2961595 RepID=UPI0020C3E969|nr:ABC transporter ATP-binding protein [Halomarina sp. BCD28]
MGVSDLTVAYGDVTAVEGVSLDVAEGEFVTVIGPSGCGKTSLLRAVGGLEAPTEGSVRVAGDPPERAQERGNVGFVFQRHTLLPWKSALGNVTFLRRLAGKEPRPEAARALLDRVGLGGFEDARPDELSGGMRQRVAIARALHLDADVLLMDEPFGELDELTRETMGIEVRRVWREAEKTVVFVTHSIPEAVLLGDRCVVVRGQPGRVVGAFDVDLPRPRDRAVLDSAAFRERVATVRSALTGREDGGEEAPVR